MPKPHACIWSEACLGFNGLSKGEVKHFMQIAVGRVTKEQAEFLKPRFHITGASGWINDPNGMFQNKDGIYHVFYQVSPVDCC